MQPGIFFKKFYRGVSGSSLINTSCYVGVFCYVYGICQLFVNL
jgi:hypothetical protein